MKRNNIYYYLLIASVVGSASTYAIEGNLDTNSTNNISTNQSDVENREDARTKLQNEIAALQTWLDGAIIGSNVGQYPQEAADRFQESIDTAKSVLESPDSTDNHFRAAFAELTEASTEFSNSLIKDSEHLEYLNDSINNAIYLINNSEFGSEVGQYPSSARDNLSNILSISIDVLNSPLSKEQDYIDAKITLDQSIEVFKNSIITEIDKTPLINLITECEDIVHTAVIGDRPTQYPKASKDAFQNTISDAKNTVTNCTFAEMQSSINSLLEARDVFFSSQYKVESIFREDLILVISVANDRVNNANEGSEPGQYNKESIDELRANISLAEETLNEVTSNQTEVDAAVANLNKAILKFDESEIKAPPIDTVTLEKLILDSEKLLRDSNIGNIPGQISQENYNKLLESKNKAIEVLTANPLSQSDIDNACQSLEKAISIFKDSYNKEAIKADLQNKIKEATDFRNSIQDSLVGSNVGQYPENSIILFEEEISLANDVFFNFVSTQEEVDNATAKLNSAIQTIKDSIIKNTVNKTKLTELIAKAVDILSKSQVGVSDGQYPEESYNALKGAIDNAKNIETNSSSTQQDIDTAYKDLNSSILAFQNSEHAGYSKYLSELRELINTCLTTVEQSVIGSGIGEYSAESVERLKFETNKASIVATSGSKSSDEYKKATTELKEALDKFKESQVNSEDIKVLEDTLNSKLSQMTMIIKDVTVGAINNGTDSNKKIALSVMYSRISESKPNLKTVDDYKGAIRLADYAMSDFNDKSISIKNDVVDGRKLTGVVRGSSEKVSTVEIKQELEFIPQAGLPLDVKSTLLAIGSALASVGVFLKNKK